MMSIDPSTPRLCFVGGHLLRQPARRPDDDAVQHLTLAEAQAFEQAGVVIFDGRQAPLAPLAASLVRLRAHSSDSRLIVVSHALAEDESAHLLAVGADFVLLERSKPYRPEDRAPVVLGPLAVYSSLRMVVLEGARLPLTPLELDIFFCLLAHRGSMLTSRDICRAVFGGEPHTMTARVRIHIYRLRKKLGSASYLVETIGTRGFRLAVPLPKE